MKNAVLFPGQGSQKVGMAREHMNRDTLMTSLFERANELLGYDLTELMFEGPDEKLKETRYTQPAIFLHSYARYQSLKESGQIQADVMAGHSLGEISALAAASVLSFEEALRLVARRGELMQQAGKEREGAMAAIIGLDAGRVQELCRQISSGESGVVVPANDNSEGQMVVSGDPDAIQAVIGLAKEQGCRMAVQIPVSGAFHSPLMEPARASFKEFLDPVVFKDSEVPVYSNYTATFTREGEMLKKNLLMQLTNPVRWREIMLDMASQGIKTYCEVGPGAVLKGLLKRTVKDAEIIVYN